MRGILPRCTYTLLDHVAVVPGVAAACVSGRGASITVAWRAAVPHDGAKITTFTRILVLSWNAGLLSGRRFSAFLVCAVRHEESWRVYQE
jgi:hypothetical protein